MRVLIIGGGGREHALAWAIERSPGVSALHITPGNPGTALLGSNQPGGDADQTVRLAEELEIDLAIVGPEAPLVAGLADRLRAKRIAVFGPSADAARLEGSKVFAKRFMRENRIPTAPFEVFDDAEAARAFVRSAGTPLVVKADGLAGGKGVLIPRSPEETLAAVDRVLVDRAFGDAGGLVLLEERLSGPELSVMAIVDGRRWLSLPPSRDHKRLLDGDEGPNTGGMGAIAPVPGLDSALLDKIDREVIDAVVSGMTLRGTPFVGCLYAGLMLTPEGPRVLEFNVRFGDPEAQVLLPLVEGDFARLLLSAAHGEIDTGAVTIREAAAATVVLAAPGYPAGPRGGMPIAGLDKLPPDLIAFHAGTSFGEDASVIASGGRVLSLTSTAPNLEGALSRAYRGTELVRFEGAHYRRDIGRPPSDQRE